MGRRCVCRDPDGRELRGLQRGRRVASSNTSGFPGSDIVLQDDGNLVIYQGSRAIWDWGAGYFGDRLQGGQTLQPGQALLSPDHQFELVMQPADGNLVLYQGSKALWAAGVAGAGAYVAMQTDGNFVVYNGGSAKWSSNTSGFPGSDIVLQRRRQPGDLSGVTRDLGLGSGLLRRSASGWPDAAARAGAAFARSPV